MHAKIIARTAPSFTYRTSHVPHGTTLYLQRQFGTKHVWENVAKLHGGKVTAPKLASLGYYRYRVHGVKAHKAVVNSAARGIYAYGNVSLARLCAVYNGYTCDSGEDGGTVEVGSHIFNYQILFSASSYPNWDHVLRYSSTSCRSISLHYAADQNGQSDPNEVSYVRVVQTSADATYSHAGSGRIGSLTAKLNGGGFYVDTSSRDDYNIDTTGSASCWSGSGRR